jgi:hypothetical protein
MTDPDPRVVDRVGELVTKTLSQASDILQSAIHEWLADVLTRLMAEQSEVIVAMDPAALSALKSGYESARDEALASAERMIKELDLDRAAPEALGYSTQERLLDFDERVDRLLDGPIDVLARGGFTVGVDDVKKGDTLIALRTSVSIAIGSYGRHMLGLMPVNEKEARAAWDRS